jgi:hypothetical protein
MITILWIRNQKHRKVLKLAQNGNQVMILVQFVVKLFKNVLFANHTIQKK